MSESTDVQKRIKKAAAEGLAALDTRKEATAQKIVDMIDEEKERGEKK